MSNNGGGMREILKKERSNRKKMKLNSLSLSTFFGRGNCLEKHWGGKLKGFLEFVSVYSVQVTRKKMNFDFRF